MNERFFLGQDNDCHWYVIPVNKREDWQAWRNIPGDDERSWSVPSFAVMLNGHPSNVTFADWKQE